MSPDTVDRDVNRIDVGVSVAFRRSDVAGLNLCVVMKPERVIGFRPACGTGRPSTSLARHQASISSAGFSNKQNRAMPFIL